MCGGANATCTQQWGLPSGVGAIVLTALVVGTVILGLEGIVKNTWEGWTDNNSDDIDCIDIYCYYRNTKLQ